MNRETTNLKATLPDGEEIYRSCPVKWWTLTIATSPLRRSLQAAPC